MYVIVNGVKQMTECIINLFVHPCVHFRCHSIMVRSEELAVAIYIQGRLRWIKHTIAVKLHVYMGSGISLILDAKVIDRLLNYLRMYVNTPCPVVRWCCCS